MSNDIRDILQRLTAVEEGKITPVGVKKGLNTQQKSVPQLPALFKPHKISVLGSNTDPAHPMKGMAVGANESKLAEAMAEIEEDMLSKVRNDLNSYLDRLEQKAAGDDGRREKETPELDKLSDKEKIDRDLIAKAVKAVQADQAEEDIQENDYELTNPETDHAVQDVVDVDAGQPQQPVSVMEMGEGIVFEVFQLGECDYEIRRGGRPMKTRFKSADDADIAMNLFKAHRNRQQRDSDNDYIEER